MRKFLLMLLAGLLLIPSLALAAPSIEELQEQIAEIAEQIEELEDRMDPVERKSAIDRINWYGDLRAKVDSLHYNNVTWNPGINVDFSDFFTNLANTNSVEVGLGMDIGDNSNPLGEFATFNAFDPDPDMDGQANFGAGTISALDRMFANLYEQNPTAFANLFTNFQNWLLAGKPAGMTGAFPMAAAPKTTDINNDIFYTTRLRLGMKAKIDENISFLGRLSMFKNWGDSVGTNVFDSWNAFSMDGTNGGKPSGDWLRVERAMFNWKDIGGTPFYLSIGRRPSTYGAPSNYRENVRRGGTPSGHMMHFNFDGITIGYKMEELTGLEGSVLRFCYGQGFESEWGNGEMFNDGSTANIDDTHIGGFNFDIFDDGSTLLQFIAFRAMDVNDGFKGTFAFPIQYAELFAPTMYQDMQKFPSFNFVTRYTPTTVIGDINLVGTNISHEFEDGLVLFASVGMTQLESNGKAGMFGGLVNDAVFEVQTIEDVDGTVKEIYMAPARAENDDTQEGYGVYVGIQTPAPMGKFGLEYNYGSEYWTPFTQSADDAMGSKLATRGHAVEAYYIIDVSRKAFIKVGGIYYDYEYTGSGSPVGKPQKISDIEAGTAYSLMPVVDTAWDAYAQMSVRW